MKIELNWPDSVPEDQIDLPFIQGMLDRMAFGFHNYGHARRFMDRPDNLANVAIRVKKYQETLNTEFLIDAANFLMMEFMVPSLPGAHFKATEHHESPGAIVAGKLIKNKDELKRPKRREGD
jgi:hypothetical protein